MLVATLHTYELKKKEKNFRIPMNIDGEPMAAKEWTKYVTSMTVDAKDIVSSLHYFQLFQRKIATVK